MVNLSFKQTGVLTENDLKKSKLLPSKARFNKGPVVVVECIEKIPCNPCADACPKNAITIENSIIEIPKVNFDVCNGCGLCIARCPGLAIFVINKNYNPKEAAISLPYEFLPRPQIGEIVLALDRKGKYICNARVEKVLDTKATDRCAVITIAVPKKYYNKVRFIKLKSE
ncbi:MAG: 4Fe-4S dicluster domain-containing protein [candidate division WOR-3 bacterium]